ncbi:MAG: SDR family NAD(P)-dependent oxidoreductase, partial [Proteobacteria bacterium]|nr:SDR family NAD(P)-dependent oxidoreductase [Pseudomonadota bacterium]
HVKEEKDDLCHLLETAGKLWLAGGEIDWQAFYKDEKRKRIGLPGYAFERKRYWVDNQKNRTQSGGKLPVADWFWQPSWRLEELADAEANIDAQDVYLILLGAHPIGADAAAQLRDKGARVVTVAQAGGYAETGVDTFVIDPANPADYRQLVAQLTTSNTLPQHIVHLWSLSNTADTASQQINSQLSFVYLAQALQDHTATLNIFAVTNKREAVLNDDQPDCKQALIAGPAKVIPFEFPHIRFATLDIDAQTAAANFVLKELGAHSGNATIAIRHGMRFVKDYVALETADDAGSKTHIKSQGVYLITGGLGGVGMAHAQALAAYQTRLALLQRSAFPTQDAWQSILDDAAADAVLKEQIKGLRALQAAGAEVLVLQADVTDAAQVNSVITTVKNKWGAINGLLHCAGYGEFVAIKETSKAIIDAVLAPKVAGTDNLLAALATEHLDFVLLCSSMSAETTGFGLLGYVSACAYLDAIAHAHTRKIGTQCVSINWDNWNTPQQTARAQNDSVLAQRLENNVNGITPREGIDVIYRALAAGKPQTIISTTDFRQLLRKNRKMSDVLQTDFDEEGSTADADSLMLYERPSLSTEYVAPTSEEEKLLASIWQETLGISKIGVNDNFFELGGESLLGVKIVVKAKKMGLQIDPKQMFATPTIADVARHVIKSGESGNASASASIIKTAANSYPLSPLQADIYRRYKDTTQSPANVIQVLSIMEGPLNKTLLQAVWQALIARHKVLRTRFSHDAHGVPIQIVDAEANFALIERDFSEMDEAAQQQALDALMIEDRQTRYDLAQTPAMRIYWTTLDPQRGRFAILLSQHQIILDGWTSSLLSRDLFACMMALASGNDLPPPVTDANFGAYIDWLLQQGGEACQTWWRQTFHGYTPVDPLQSMMAVHPLLSADEQAYGDHEMILEESLLTDIQTCAKTTRTTANAIFQSAWALSLAQLSGNNDIVYGITISGRDTRFDGVEEIVGQCTNSLPVRVAIADNMKIADLLQAVHVASSDAQTHNGLSASQIAELVGCAPGQSLYSSNVIYENVPRATSGEGDVPIKTIASKWVDGWHFPLRLFIVPEETTWVRLAYDRNKFADVAIAALAESYRRNLAAIAVRPEADLAQIAHFAQLAGGTV